MKKNLVLLLGVALLQVPAIADSIKAENFKLSPSFQSIVLDGALSEKGEFGRKRKWLFRGAYSYVDDPLIEINTTRTELLRQVIDNMHTFDFGVSYLVSSKVLLDLNTSIHQVKSDEFQRNKQGDSQLGVKVRLSEPNRSFSWAIKPFLVFPTGNASSFTTDDSFGGGVLVSYEKVLHRFNFFGNLGYQWMENAEYLNIDLKQRAILGAGFSYDLTQKIDLNLEWKGEFGLPFDEDQNPVELYGAVKHHTTEHINSFLALGVGGIDFTGKTNTHSNDYRLLLAFKILTKKEKEAVKPKPAKVVRTVVKEEDKRVLEKKLLVLKGVKFKYNTAELTNKAVSILDDVYSIITHEMDIINAITVEGHTDLNGSAVYNLDLSKRRANTVRNYLIDKGLSPELLKAVGYGETKPLVKGISIENNALNRRVEFAIDYK